MNKFTFFANEKNSTKHLLALMILAMVVLLNSCKTKADDPNPQPTGNGTETFSSDVATRWYNLQLKLIKDGTGFTPPVASRALGYSGVALYEAVVPGMTGYQSLVGQLSELTTLPKPDASKAYNWAVAANAAEASIVKSLFGNATEAQKATIDSLEIAINLEYKLATEFEASAKFGKDIASAIFEWSKTDKGHEGYTRNQPKDYTPPVGPGFWIQTTAGDAGRAVQPYWGQNRFFVPSNAAMSMPPLAYSYETSISSTYFAQALEVYSVGKNLSAEQKTIAIFWADGGKTITPPGHSINITSIYLNVNKGNLAQAAEAYAKVGMAVADAFINCWKCKYKYNWQRPISYITQAIDPTWKPLIPTPNFPEFSSGHSTQSGAAAQVLSDMFGYQQSFTDNTHQARGAGFEPRTFSNFFEFADEAAISRLYGGIHYRSGNELGLREGKKVGKNITALKFKK